VDDNKLKTLVSVIVPCYNQGKYLTTAIESILCQSYKNFEIIVVDDGSTDDTKEIALKFDEVTYVYQSNQGLSAARNKGIAHSKGKYLVFLDSDDWLLPMALEVNLQYLLQQPTLAFVSGAHQFFYKEENKSYDVIKEVKDNNYNYLLVNNYIAMIATVMFHKWVFDNFKYDTTLKVCEDYDLYLNVARSHPIFHHTQIIAVYYIHNSNSSGNTSLMLSTALMVLQRQKINLRNNEEQLWYEEGINFWKSYYTEIMYNKMIVLLHQGQKSKKEEVQALKKHNRHLYNSFIKQRNATLTRNLKNAAKAVIKKLLPVINRSGTTQQSVPQPAQVDLGSLNRTNPFSEKFGYDRGGPVDRYYIENFLKRKSALISGRVLEIGDNEYTLMFGKDRVLQSDILHIDESNTKATFIGDLSDAPQIPNNSFDCIVLTQTLHLIYDFKSAIKTCYRILKPNGSLLITVPGISHIAQDQWGKYWFWSFTDNAINRALSECFSPSKVVTETFGNVLVATAFLYGMGLPELSKKQMDDHDPHYQVIITAVAVK
jgi:glycosyltransferase involved in cell wall biosynthesis/SAM-dependent methyltransferase